MTKNTLTISSAVLWSAAYFGIMLFYTFLDVAVWRTLFPQYAEWINLFVMILCGCAFLLFLAKRYQVPVFSNMTFVGLLLAAGCSVLFFLLLDHCLDPIFESIFPQSEEDYQETIQSLIHSPITSFLQVCIIAPVVEETLMRGVILGGLKNTYDSITALLVSSVLFAVLHFNMVQTLSAFMCGIVLGLLYLRTRSVFCCIIAHCGYNFISYLTTIYPYII